MYFKRTGLMLVMTLALALSSGDLLNNGECNAAPIAECISHPAVPGASNVFVLGDVNMDGVLTLADVVPFLAAVAANDHDIDEADINTDGKVNMVDVPLFTSLLAGELKKTP